MTQVEWEEEMAAKVLRATQNEIYLEMRFFDVPLSALQWKSREGIATFATDGNFLFYPAEALFRLYKDNPVFLNRLYLHSVLHCVFSHLWLKESRDSKIWSLACDIVVEYTIDTLEKSCTKRPLSFFRKQVYEELLKGKKRMAAALVYDWLLTKDKDKIEALLYEFYTDNHSFWPQEEKLSNKQQETAQNWDRIRRQSSMEMEKNGKDKSQGEQTLKQELETKRSRRSYKEFLRKFTVLKEELHCDPEEFDLNFYTYGLQLYGNMPLIEPLESREVLKIQEFVIVLDTSFSTSGSLVKQFLKETFSILSERDCFFHRSKLRIIQCDDKVQMDEQITKQEELDRMLRRFTLVGGGGTDFRPAFQYIHELQEQGELRDLRGVLYFTDGKGIYPKKGPKYPVAFCFLEDYEERQVPVWAMQVRIAPEELKEQGKTKERLGKQYEY